MRKYILVAAAFALLGTSAAQAMGPAGIATASVSAIGSTQPNAQGADASVTEVRYKKKRKGPRVGAHRFCPPGRCKTLPPGAQY